MAAPQGQELAFAGFFVSHPLVDAGYCRQLILPAIEAVVDRGFNQYVFMDYENFGRGHKADGSNAHVFANAYATSSGSWANRKRSSWSRHGRPLVLSGSNTRLTGGCRTALWKSLPLFSEKPVIRHC